MIKKSNNTKVHQQEQQHSCIWNVVLKQNIFKYFFHKEPTTFSKLLNYAVMV